MRVGRSMIRSALMRQLRALPDVLHPSDTLMLMQLLTQVRSQHDDFVRRPFMSRDKDDVAEHSLVAQLFAGVLRLIADVLHNATETFRRGYTEFVLTPQMLQTRAELLENAPGKDMGTALMSELLSDDEDEE